MDLRVLTFICVVIGTVISIYLLFKSLFRKKSKNDVRKNIKLYVDKIEKSYRGKITTLEPTWKKGKDDPTHPVHLPFSDINDFKKLSDLYERAGTLLSPKEKKPIHELIKIFETEKYNSDMIPSGEVINAKSIYKIADLAKKLQDLIGKKLSK